MNQTTPELPPTSTSLSRGERAWRAIRRDVLTPLTLIKALIFVVSGSLFTRSLAIAGVLVLMSIALIVFVSLLAVLFDGASEEDEEDAY